MAEVPRTSENIDSGRSNTSNEMTLIEAIEARDRFLLENPRLREFQAEIDATLRNVVGYENRIAVLGLMMESRIYQLKAIIEGLLPDDEAAMDLPMPERTLEDLLPAVKRGLH